MSLQPPPAKWIIVTTEAELKQFIAANDVAPALLQMAPPDPVGDSCQGCCQDSALAEVKRGRPVALLVSASQRILQLRIPIHGRIVDRWQSADGRLCFRLTGSPQQYAVPAHVEFADPITAGLMNRTNVLVIDPVFDGHPVMIRPVVPFAPPFRCNQRFDLNVNDLSVLDAKQACLLYRDIYNAGAVSPFESGLPFRYSRAYCHVVAHAVARMLQSDGLVVGKAWVFAKPRQLLTLSTSSRRTCREQWWFHVAVVARSAEGDLWVFDPTSRLERGVTTLGEWKDSFRGSVQRVQLTRRDAYFLECDAQAQCNIDDPCFDTGDDDELNAAIGIALCALRCVTKIDGPPPFRCDGFGGMLPNC